jgi:hypothetical protein
MPFSVVDLLADPQHCNRDIPLLQQMKINTLVYLSVDPSSASYSYCFKKLQDAGIYVIMRVDGWYRKGMYFQNNTIMRIWDYNYYDYMENVIDTFQGYSNVLGYFISASTTYDGSTFLVRNAAVAHMKEYIRKKGYRSIPVGMNVRCRLM